MYHAADVREIRPKREMHDSQANGGPVIDMGVHLFDLWSYIFESEPVQVFAQGLKLAQDRPELAHIGDIAYDTATILVRYASGDMGTFFVSWGQPPGVVPSQTPDRILGPKGIAQASYDMAYQQVEVIHEQSGWQTLFTSSLDMYQAEIARFAQWVLEDQPFPATGAEGVAALRVALAALTSVATGQPVSLS
jgi:myo-inositol 2-dehydrogenase/D-chiro-inositol 1-dehydrogenase